MDDLDFLPIEYREEYERWRLQPWQIGAAMVVVVLVAGAASFQHFRWRQAQKDLAIVAPQYEKAVSLQSRLSDVQGQLVQVQASVDLHGYVRRSGRLGDLLAALVAAPEDVVLDEVRVTREAAEEPSRHGKSSTPDKAASERADESKPVELSAADRDLTKLRRRADSMETIVVVGGTATSIERLRQYLASLETTQSLENAELTRLDRVSNADPGGAVRFRAVLAIPPNAEGVAP